MEIIDLFFFLVLQTWLKFRQYKMLLFSQTLRHDIMLQCRTQSLSTIS